MNVFERHPKPWKATPLWQSTSSPWCVRDARHQAFVTADDELTAKAIVEWSERAQGVLVIS